METVAIKLNWKAYYRVHHWIFDRLDEVLTGIFLLMLVGLGLWRGAPIFEEIRSSVLAWRTMQIVCVTLLISVVFLRAKVVQLLRDWLPFVLSLMTYEGLKHMHATAITTALGITPIDPVLVAIDRFLFGELAHQLAQRFIDGSILILFALKIFYIAYYFLPGLVLGYLYFFADRYKFMLVRRSVVICLYGGYAMYVLLPAAGPQFDMSQLGKTPTGILHAYTYAMQHLRYSFDCFPSLHTALPWTLATIAWRYLPDSMRVILAICAAGSTAAAVGLGFHYGIDVIGGLMWSATVLLLTRLSMRKQ